MVRINEYPKVGIVGGNDAFVIETGTAGTMQLPAGDALYKLIDAAGMVPLHAMVPRGKNLGTSFTADQKAAIQSGTFKDIWLGDYWVINGKKLRVVDIDYFYHELTSPLRTHHIVVMPDDPVGTEPLLDTNDVATNGLLNSYYRRVVEPKINADAGYWFGAANIVQHVVHYTSSYDANWKRWNVSKITVKTALPMVEQLGGSCNQSAVYDGESFSVRQFKLFEIDKNLAVANELASWKYTRTDSNVGPGYFLGTVMASRTTRLFGTQANGIRPYFLVG